MSMFKLLWQQIRVRPGAYLIAAGGWALFNTIILVPGLLMQRIFDGVADGVASWSVIGLIAIFVSVTVARVASTIPAVYWQVTFEYGLASKLRRDLMDRLLRRPAARASGSPPAGLVNTMRDDVNAVVTAPIALMDTVTSGIFTVVALVVLANTNLLATLVVVIPLMVVFPIVRAAAGRVTRFRRAGREATVDVTSFLTSALEATTSVQVNDASERVVSRLRALNYRRERALVRDETVSAVVPAVTIQMATVGAGLVLLATAELLRSGEFTVGDLALFDAYLYHCVLFAAGIAGFLTTWRQAQVSLGRLGETTGTPVWELLQTPPADDPPPLASLRTVRVRDISVRHGDGGGVDSADDADRIDLVLEPGMVVVVVGPVGAGKSTLLRAATRSLATGSGSVSWNGQPLDDDRVLVPPRCGAVTQHPATLGASIRVNVDIGRDLPEEVLMQALRDAELADDIAVMPQGIDTEVGARGQTLSGGQAQRLAIARMLAGRCDLYVLDDATSAIDLPTERRLWARLLPNSSAAWMIATQRSEVLQYATHVVLMRDGRVVAQGSADELREHLFLTGMRGDPPAGTAPVDDGANVDKG
jgi:ATP-binding cassette, subfamily B, bacterial